MESTRRLSFASSKSQTLNFRFVRDVSIICTQNHGGGTLPSSDTSSSAHEHVTPLPRCSNSSGFFVCPSGMPWTSPTIDQSAIMTTSPWLASVEWRIYASDSEFGFSILHPLGNRSSLRTHFGVDADPGILCLVCSQRTLIGRVARTNLVTHFHSATLLIADSGW